MRTNKKTAIGVAAVGVFALSLGIAAPANADYAPTATDAVGIGGDTPQYDLSFLADGDISGHLGYNAAGNANKFISFDSVPDANGRNAFDSNSTPTTPVNLNPTIVLRAGTAPITRPQSTGIGFTIFKQDTTKRINWIRTGRLPTPAEQTLAGTNGWGFLHSIKIATDKIQIAAASTTNAPAGLSVPELVKIYKGEYLTWGDIPGYTGPAPSETIQPFLPPTTSVVRTTLLDALQAANGGVALVIDPVRVKTVQQNDPTAITSLSAADKKNAIVSFSAARLGLWGTGFFRDPSVPSSIPNAPLSAGIQILGATAPDGQAAYSGSIGHYVVFRQSDYLSTTPWQPGSTKNWVQALFYDGAAGSPFIKKPAGQTLITSSGAVAEYTDLGSAAA